MLCITQSFRFLGMVFGLLIGGIVGSFALSLTFVISSIMTVFILLFGKSYLTFIHNQRKK